MRIASSLSVPGSLGESAISGACIPPTPSAQRCSPVTVLVLIHHWRVRWGHCSKERLRSVKGGVSPSCTAWTPLLFSNVKISAAFADQGAWPTVPARLVLLSPPLHLAPPCESISISRFLQLICALGLVVCLHVWDDATLKSGCQEPGAPLCMFGAGW